MPRQAEPSSKCSCVPCVSSELAVYGRRTAIARYRFIGLRGNLQVRRLCVCGLCHTQSRQSCSTMKAQKARNTYMPSPEGNCKKARRVVMAVVVLSSNQSQSAKPLRKLDLEALTVVLLSHSAPKHLHVSPNDTSEMSCHRRPRHHFMVCVYTIWSSHFPRDGSR